jgi:hypothetical protein
MAEERPKPDSERDPDFQERNWDRLVQEQQRAQKSYDPAIVKAVLAFYLDKLKELPPEQVCPNVAEASSFGAVQAKLPITPKGSTGLQPKIAARMGVPQGNPTASLRSQPLSEPLPKQGCFGHIGKELFTDALTVDNPEVRVELFKNASLEDLQKSSDPVVQFVLALRPLTKAIEDAEHIYDGHMALLGPQYVDARKAFYGRTPAPDANGTLRVTYGTVRGYRPSPEAAMYEPFTTLTGLVAKHTGEAPFNAPPDFLDAAKAGPYPPPFASEELGDVPMDFLADLDITGGNSGSATLNRKGQLVGLVFDGNSESVASNLLFMPDITRSIHVDIRTILWLMKYVDHADTLLEELRVQ